MGECHVPRCRTVFEKPHEFRKDRHPNSHFGEAKVQIPDPKYAMVDRHGRVLEKSFVPDTDQVLVHDSLDYLSSLGRGKSLSPWRWPVPGPRSTSTPPRCIAPSSPAAASAPAPTMSSGPSSWNSITFTGCGTSTGCATAFRGLSPKYGHDLVDLTPEAVANIHIFGGTMLSTSRGPQDTGEIVDALDRINIRILFLIGGDGTLRAATEICQEIARRELRISVIVIPKTIDNDIPLVSRSFGFDTAVEVATEAIHAAHTEAVGSPNGIGLVKLMGRFSGFIAATATLALREVNYVLIPEADFDLDGECGLLANLE